MRGGQVGRRTTGRLDAPPNAARPPPADAAAPPSARSAAAAAAVWSGAIAAAPALTMTCPRGLGAAPPLRPANIARTSCNAETGGQGGSERRSLLA